MKLKIQAHKACYLAILLTAILLSACQPQPQKAKHLSQKNEIDTTLLAQLQFNTRMVEVSDKACMDWVLSDSLTYAMHEMGFWFTKTIKKDGDILTNGQEVNIHMLISELNGELISDTKHSYKIGSSELPNAIRRTIGTMVVGEQAKIVAPWYTAYGVEGTSIIKPYSNLIILLTIEE